MQLLLVAGRGEDNESLCVISEGLWQCVCHSNVEICRSDTQQANPASFDIPFLEVSAANAGGGGEQ